MEKIIPDDLRVEVKLADGGAGSNGAFVAVCTYICFGDHKMFVGSRREKTANSVAVVPAESGYPYKRMIYGDRLEIDKTPDPIAVAIVAACTEERT